MAEDASTGRKPSGNRISNRLLALSSAAVMTVYAAGYLRTQSAAAKLEAAERNRIVIPVAARDTHGSAAPAVTRALPSSQPAVTRVDPAPTTAGSASTAVKKSVARAKKKTEPAAATPVNVAPTQAATAAPAAAAESAVVPATTPVPTPTPAPATASAALKDGSYTGWGTSRHGDIQATVVIEGGRIASAVISQCLTRYSCSWVAHLQGQVVARQSPEVDYVSGATQSTNAFYYAVVEALAKAK